MQSEYRSTAQHTWDSIAESFDTTRQKPWKNCLDFINSLDQDSIVADLGCGNGRHLFPCAHRCSRVFGVDLSQRFLHIIRRKLLQTPVYNITLIHGDVVFLPFADQSIDAVLYIAALHNIQGREHREASLREVTRVLKPQGVALISVWSRWQEKFYKHFLKQFIMRKHEYGDIEIWWRQHNLNIPRFYHLYSKGEFIQDLETAGLKIQHLEAVRIHSQRFPDNYFAVVKKA
jgi:tRNA (uracil-5-)-methyltransferase TRM9